MNENNKKMKHSVCIICMLFLGGIAAAQSKVVTNFDSILVDSNHMAIVKSEVITVVFANGTDSGIAHTKTVYVNDQEILVPHELTNIDAVNLVTGKVSEVVYHDQYKEPNVSFWKQIIQPWNIKMRHNSKRYTLTQDAQGFFVPGPDIFTKQGTTLSWWFIVFISIAIVFGIDIVIFQRKLSYYWDDDYSDNFLKYLYKRLFVGIFIVFIIAFGFLVIIKTAGEKMGTHNLSVILWYFGILISSFLCNFILKRLKNSKKIKEQHNLVSL